MQRLARLTVARGPPAAHLLLEGQFGVHRLGGLGAELLPKGTQLLGFELEVGQTVAVLVRGELSVLALRALALALARFDLTTIALAALLIGRLALVVVLVGVVLSRGEGIATPARSKAAKATSVEPIAFVEAR